MFFRRKSGFVFFSLFSLHSRISCVADTVRRPGHTKSEKCQPWRCSRGRELAFLTWPLAAARGGTERGTQRTGGPWEVGCAGAGDLRGLAARAGDVLSRARDPREVGGRWRCEE